MPGFKPKADLAFRDIRIAIIRLTNASDTQQQHEVIRNLLKGLAQIEPLWGVTPTEPKPTRRTSNREREQGYREAETRLMNGQPVPQPSYEDKLRWHQHDPVNFPHPDGEVT